MKPLSSPLQQYWQTVVERLPEPLAEESLSAQAKSVLTFSDFVQDSVIAHPEWLTELESQPPQADEWQHYAAWLQEALSNVSDEAGLMRELRLFRRRIMVRIAWAQTLALVTEESILQQLSHLAETLEMLSACRGSRKTAAERLYLHRNTMSYRLNQIEEVLGCDLSDAGQLEELGFACRVKEYM